MASFEHLLASCDVTDMLDDIASAEPPAYLRRCFAEGCSTPRLSWARVQELTVCAMVLDAVIDERDYEILEPELIADWRVHYGHACARIREVAVAALHRAQGSLQHDPDAAAELSELVQRLASA
ncbi:MAG TPA: hypothetical protein VK437_06405 [Steroidobacteraceae bacterium]|nr:hypothetical protein [Steroidobacteraceae bacterium]